MKTLEFIYQETQIHFLINPTDKNVMINATEMASAFNKKTELFLKSKHAKAFIKVLNLQPNGGQIINNRGRNGIYFHRILALKFAAWLDVEFELWVFSKIEEITFGNYKKHWDAHAAQEAAKEKMTNLKNDLLINPTLELVQQYFTAENNFKSAKAEKSKAIRNQLNLFEHKKTDS